jgi:site-specific DNA-cytosine methylase
LTPGFQTGLRWLKTHPYEGRAFVREFEFQDAKSAAAMHNNATSTPKMIELFCGIGGFRVAGDRLGLKTVWANDLNPNACTVYRDRFGADVLHEGDIRTLLDDIPPHDILTAGFPCQSFSAAGKKEGTRDPRGTLFQSIVDVLKKEPPKRGRLG